jgi:protein phosphatase
MVRPAFDVRWSVQTHTGLVRDHNEDDYLVLVDAGLYVVADGMGGHNAGAEASRICVTSVAEFFGRDLDNDATDATTLLDGTGLVPQAIELRESLRFANREIFAASLAERSFAGMGTTAVGIRLFGEVVAVAHAGDSRCYLSRDGVVRQVTADHSLSNFLLALGKPQEAHLAELTMSNVIMRALGLEPDVAVETQQLRAQSGDRWLLCSDGLSDLVPADLLRELMLDREVDRDTVVERLVNAALDYGGRDNITVLIVDIGEAIALEVEPFDGEFDPNAETSGLPQPESDSTTIEVPVIAEDTDDQE